MYDHKSERQCRPVSDCKVFAEFGRTHISMQNRSPSKWSLNPIELVIFLCCFGMFTVSAYRLIFMAPTTIPVATAEPPQVERKVASLQSQFIQVEIPCSDHFETETTASKVRLISKFCKGSKVESPAAIKTLTVIHGTNRFNATVFVSNDQFSTDFIPLVNGENPIQIEMEARDGSKITREIAFKKF